MCFLFSLHTPHYQNVPFEVPDNWVWTTVENICSKIGSGSTPKGSNYTSDGIFFFRSQNVHNLGIVLDDIKYISEDVHKSMIGTEVRPNDLLLNITGGSLGRCAIVPNIIDRGNVSQHVCILRPISIKAEYLHTFILSSFFARTMKITGSGREGLPKYNLEKMFLPLPPFAEQQRIVAEIKRWFAFVDQIEQSKANLQTAIKQAKSKILDLAIHGKLVPQDPNDEPAIELLKRINPDFIPCDNGHYTQLPQGWTVCKIKQITNITNGKSQKNVETPNGIYPIYGSGGVIGRANQYLCIAGSTIIGRKGTINNPIFVEEHFWNVDTAFGLKADSALLDKYLYYFCLSFDFSKLDKSTAMPSLTKTSIGDVLIPVPPYQEQKRIVSKIDTVLDTINVIMESL
ncbi:restriction endonuclease subunit S [Bacteroides fragilis]|uniref:restriction endonuclease subunit S n=1 Tax=Bacteroides fragilis TaxID=817 RepID=UPI000C2AF751|nr:restriction endonuclease subunit S [Bacteroides fragilis]MCS2344504.1 restriction endonuclease subunit S [Bacteroides fragilis]